MPLRDYRGYLWDIADASERILEFNRGKTLEIYLSDDLTRMATERALSIIGEALAQARQFFPQVEQDISQVAQIVGFRNRSIHNYLDIDNATVWQIVQDFIPILLGEAKQTLEHLEAGDERL